MEIARGRSSPRQPKSADHETGAGVVVVVVVVVVAVLGHMVLLAMRIGAFARRSLATPVGQATLDSDGYDYILDSSLAPALTAPEDTPLESHLLFAAQHCSEGRRSHSHHY